MQKTPCEYMQWQGLPVIRKELILSMINNHGLRQKEAAEKLGITPASVSQYLARKRGKISIIDRELLLEINFSAKKIIKQGADIVPFEMCRICKIFRKHGILSFATIR